MRYHAKCVCKTIYFKSRAERKLLEKKYRGRMTEVYNNFIIVM